MHTTALKACLVIATLATGSASAEVVSSSATHFTLRHTAESSMSASQMWDRLLQPSAWWHPDHTYSGSSQNLTLDAQAGGLWKETWDDNSVAHGEVLLIEKGKTLRLSAPFGPLQSVGAYSVWTISINALDEGCAVTFSETAIGPPTAKLDELASAVDFVKSEAIRRLVGVD